MTKLKVNRDDLEIAFDINDYDSEAYIDCQTGRVITIYKDFSVDLDDVADDDRPLETILAEIEEESGELMDWVREVVSELIVIRRDKDERYLEIPSQNSRTGYQDMEDFIDTLTDPHQQELLSVAIQGSGAFRRFKDTLFRYPDTQTAWFEFERQQKDERMLAWLRANNVDAEFE